MKHDIKHIPFDKLYTEFVDKYNQEKSEALEIFINSSKHAYNNKVKRYTEMLLNSVYSDSEAGSDGIEEAVREAIGDFEEPTELSADQVKTIGDKVAKELVDKFVQEYKLGINYTWIMPQIVSRFGSWKPIKDSDGLYNARLTLEENKTNFDIGILMVLGLAKRGDLLAGKDVRVYKQPLYNSFVPIPLYGFKVYQNIPYSSWSRNNLLSLVEEKLARAMLCTPSEEILKEKQKLREQGLMTLSGVRAGTMKSPVTTYGLNHVQKDPYWIEKGIEKIPEYALMMIAQTWCAHPANRSNAMILDPLNWDNMPDPIVDTEVIKPSNTYISNINDINPWA